MNRRGFTLIEGVVGMLILSIAVPVSVVMMADASSARAASMQRERAVELVDVVRSEIVADMAAPSEGAGTAQLDDHDTYEETLRTRIAPYTQPYEDAGLTWSLDVGSEVGPTGVRSLDDALNVYRGVTVSVSWRDARAGQRTLDITLYVTEIGA